AVIDDTIYNGPVPADTIRAAARDLLSGTPDGAVIKPVDQLPSPYLLFSVDCDAANEGELQDYLCDLWEVAGLLLSPPFANCCSSHERVTSAESFATYVCDHQVETPMPFNDYWTDAPPLKGLSIITLAVAALAAGALWGACLYLALE